MGGVGISNDENEKGKYKGPRHVDREHRSLHGRVVKYTAAQIRLSSPLGPFNFTFGSIG